MSHTLDHRADGVSSIVGWAGGGVPRLDLADDFLTVYYNKVCQTLVKEGDDSSLSLTRSSACSHC